MQMPAWQRQSRNELVVVSAHYVAAKNYCAVLSECAEEVMENAGKMLGLRLRIGLGVELVFVLWKGSKW